MAASLAGEPADIFGFEGRGYLRPGYAADVTVFDPTTVAPGPSASCTTCRPTGSV
jgi:N-acyl-D-aspartate/D-glutamate deacylase